MRKLNGLDVCKREKGRFFFFRKRLASVRVRARVCVFVFLRNSYARVYCALLADIYVYINI